MICVRWRAGGHARHRGTWTSAGLSDARVHAAVRVCGPAMRVVRAHLWRHRPDGVGLEHFVRARRLEAEKMMLRVPQRRETCAPSRTRQSEIAHCRRASGVCEVRARALRAWRRAARRLASPPTWRSRAARTLRQALLKLLAKTGVSAPRTIYQRLNMTSASAVTNRTRELLRPARV
jgi:hypothetical protein